MDSQKVDLFIISNSKYFESHQLFQIKERLLQMDDNKWAVIQTMQFKDPTISIIISVFLGSWGIDRFIIGDTGLGIGKLLTCGGLGIWYIVDLFLIMGATKEKNFESLMQMIQLT
ncbi:MAG: TM2 domain-containing protein [Breznakibacter sp.]|nr:TM2 domain-containing protein [Breznakibacter sp.]